MGVLSFLVLSSLSLAAHRETPDSVANARAQAKKLIARLSADGYHEAAKLSLEPLAALGASEKELDRVREDLERVSNRSAKEERLDAASKDATRVAAACMTAAKQLQGEEASRIARVALQFDSQLDAANEFLGHVRSDGGRWLTPEQATMSSRRLEIAAAIAQARTLPLTVTVREATDPALLAILGSRATAVEHEGLVFESYLPRESLVQTVESLVRAMAFSTWLVHGQMAPRHEAGKILHLPPESYDAFLSQIVATKRVDPRNPTPSRESEFEYVLTPVKGTDVYRSYAVSTASMRPNLGPVVLALYDRSLPRWNWATWYEEDPPIPFWLVVGHLGLVSTSVLGATPASFSRTRDSELTSSSSTRRSLLLGDAGLIGCRSYLRELAREGKAPAFSSCIQSQFGKIVEEKRLKAISVVEHLHELRALPQFVRDYDEAHSKDRQDPSKAGNPTDRAEQALGCSLPELDKRWQDWILGSCASVRDLLEARRPQEPTDPVADKVLAMLNDRRAAAGLQPVAFDPELSAGATAHAAYLARYPEQASRWPDAHEQQPNTAEFSAAGAWAGAHSVITNGPVEECIDVWLATFYHRLPLLEPGLLRVGFGRAGAINVLDAGSVVNPGSTWVSVWPYDGQQGVPRTFPGELPPPVPDRLEPHSLGYPVTIQLGPRDHAPDLTIELLDSAGDPVPCILSTPSAPSNPQLTPNQAWCLVPVEPLGARKGYRVRAKWGATVREWGFETGP